MRPTVAAFACLALAGAPAAVAGVVTLENSDLLVSFDADTGALTQLESKTTPWTIERRPDLGASFRLFVPLPGRRDNFVLGESQHAAEVTKLSDHEARLKWTNPVSEHGGILPITLTALVSLDGGALTFSATLENGSPFMVETVDYPRLGDLNPPSRDSSMQVRTMRYDNLSTDEIYPKFANEKGYWGVFYPTKTFESGFTPYCLIQAPHEGVYVEMRDPTERYLLQYTFVQMPGVEGATEQVPQSDTLSGLPVHQEFRACHFIFAHPHSTVTLAPVVIEPYAGDWHAGVDRYKRWRATWYKPPHVPEWAKAVHSWQEIQANTPEQNYAVPYRDLPRYGEDCAANGVRAIQLVGWNHGGQDGGNPSQDTDPGLGTWQELHDAIAKTQALGVKIILFGKFTWADETTAWYRNELCRYASTDPYGVPYQTMGDSYITPTQLAAINNHRFAIMDFLSPAYRAVAAHEFQKILNLGASGWLFDEVCDRTSARYNFSQDHGYLAPGYIYAGALPLGRELRAEADRVDPDFLFAGEGPQDWLTQYYPLSYFRGSPTPIERYIDSQIPIMIGVMGFDDREKLNDALMDRYIISYEPYNFKGRLSDFPLTLEYGKKIDALRSRYRAWLWEAEFRDTLGAKVTGKSAIYSVFVTPAGKRAVVVVNPESDRAIATRVELPHPGSLVVATPENPDAVPTDGSLRIPVRSAAVVMEQ